MSLELITVIGLVVVVVLFVVLRKALATDQIQEFINRRKATAKLAVPAEFIEGRDHFNVALAVDDKVVYYENNELQASIDLERIDEVEYDDELATGQEVSNGEVLRLRSHGHVFEFIVRKEDIDKCRSVLPPHHMDEPGSVHAV